VKSLKCIVFNVEHGLCVFVKSPVGYGLLIDCGSRDKFSPIKWIRGKYNVNTPGFKYYNGRQYAEMVVTHLHADHFSDIGSFKNRNDRPKTLARDKRTLTFIEEKIAEAKEDEDDAKLDILEEFLKFSDAYTEDVDVEPDWGFDLYERYQLPYNRAEKVDADREKIINNRSFVIGIGYAGKKIVIPGDIEVGGWDEALDDKNLQDVIAETNFFVASHHGHKSGFTKKILDHSGKPDIFIISARSGDESIDSAYSDSHNSNGYRITGDARKSHSVSTRKRDRSIEITFNEDGTSSIELFKADDNLNENQQRLRQRRTRRTTSGWGL